MGRPLNKRFFGAPTAGGNELKVQFFNGTSSVDGWIIKQKATREFRCSDGTNERDCYLVDVAAASLVADEMSISMKLDDTTVKRVIKIAARKVTLGDGAGGVYDIVDANDSIGWNFDDSAIDGRVEAEEAGDPTNIITSGSFVVGVEYEIVVPGTTVFTTEHPLTATGDLAGDTFTAEVVGTGDGTAVPTADAEGDTFGI